MDKTEKIHHNQAEYGYLHEITDEEEQWKKYGKLFCKREKGHPEFPLHNFKGRHKSCNKITVCFHLFFPGYQVIGMGYTPVTKIQHLEETCNHKNASHIINIK